MSGAFGSSQWAYSSGVAGYQIEDSLRFDDVSNTYLNRTASSPTLGTKATWSFWIKKSDVSTDTSTSYKTIFYAGTPNVDGFRIGFARYGGYNNHEFHISQDLGSSSASFFARTAALFRDVSSWYNFVIYYDSTDATAANRLKVYVNGELQSFSGTLVYPSLNRIPTWQVNGKTLRIGKGADGYNEEIDMYLSDFYFIDGQALDPTDFGETIDGYWRAIPYAGTYGTNGFHLDFNGNTNDASGNGNNWTANNISAHDYVPDSPTNNFATFNPLVRRRDVTTLPTFSEGNLKVVYPNAGGNVTYAAGTIPITSGKWYYESRINSLSTNNVVVGWATEDEIAGTSSHVMIYSATGGIYIDGNLWSTEGALSVGDIIGTTIDLDNGYVGFYKNGVALSFSPSISITSANWWNSGGLQEFLFAWNRGSTSDGTSANFGQDSTFAGATTAGGNTDANGIGDFKYAPPAGFLSLCSSSLPIPTIIDGSEHFNTLLWTGDGTSSRSFTGYGFAPDFLWAKQRSQAIGHSLYDSVRGAGANSELASDNTGTEGAGNHDQYGYLSSFDSDGFTAVDGTSSPNYYFNENSQTFVGWGWKAGGTAVSNTDGSITSQVSANVDAGFSVVSWTGNATAGATVGHGLGVQPSMIITKNRNNGSEYWSVYHKDVGNTAALFLNSTGAAYTSSAYWNNTSPTTSVFSIGSNPVINESGSGIIAYCFANSDIIKAGSYTGNGSDDGTFVYTGGKIQWLMIKASSAAGENWYVFDTARDTYNAAGLYLYANTSAAETDFRGTYPVDFTSNGFKLRDAVYPNVSGRTYIYLAIMESPFKVATAR